MIQRRSDSIILAMVCLVFISTVVYWLKKNDLGSQLQQVQTDVKENIDIHQGITSNTGDIYKYVEEKPAGSAALEFQRIEEHVATQQAVCKMLRRIGGEMPTRSLPDPGGAWWVCFDKEVKLDRGNCIVYSVGIKDDWSFDEEMSRRYGCEVFSFDPSIGMDDHEHAPSVHFYNLGLADVDSEGDPTGKGRRKWKMRNLDSIIRQLNHTERLIDVLKIDIERDEFKALPQMLASGTLRRQVKQLVIEFHISNRNDTSKYCIIKWLERQGFLITNLHRNAQYRICLEVSYVNMNLVPLPTNSYDVHQ